MNDLTDIETLISRLAHIKEQLNKKQTPIAGKVNSAIDELLVALNDSERKRDENEVTDIGLRGCALLDTLFFETYKSVELRQLHQKISLALGYWIAINQGTLKAIEYPVNALAQMANTLYEKTALEALYEVAAYLVMATDEQIKMSSDNSSWRILIMNYSIIATRTHNPDLMDSAFSSLLEYFPDLAPAFFKQGMSEMVRLNYPPHVRVVMERYSKQFVD